MALYSLTDNEDALEMAQAEMLAESLLNQGEQSNIYNENADALASKPPIKSLEQTKQFGDETINIQSQGSAGGQ